MEYKLKLKYFLFSCATLIIYLLGIIIISYVNGVPWYTVPAFWVEIIHLPIWLRLISAITIIAGILLIYFIPGIFIAKEFFQEKDDLIETFTKGFLINYLLYYIGSAIYKIFSSGEFTRGIFVILITIFILIFGIILFYSRRGSVKRTNKPSSFKYIKFAVFYIALFVILLSLFWKKIFVAPFCSDGVEQFWLAHSVKTETLPTFYQNTPATLIPQFPFAPSVYLNMFALSLFGNAEFIIRLEILIALICLGFILRGLIIKMTNRELTLFDYIPLFLYLAIFFIIITYRSFYHIPTGLAKSNETLQLCLFMTGFYFLIQNHKEKNSLSAILFILASMIRHNGFFIIVIFLILYSFLFKNYRCLVIYCMGIVFLLLSLQVVLFLKHYSFSEMWKWLMINMRGLYYKSIDFKFFWAYLKNFLFFTAGLPLFMFLNYRNKYNILISIVTLIYLFFPIRSWIVPAHFFVPVMMFPLVSYYLMDLKRKKIVTAVVITFEILALSWAYPKKETAWASVFRENLAKVCINSDNLFEAQLGCTKFNELMNTYANTGFDARLTMYYGDLSCKENKEYLIYFGTLPFELNKNYHKIERQKLPIEGHFRSVEDSINVYFKNGQQSFKDFVEETAGDYYSDKNEPFIVERD